MTPRARRSRWSRPTKASSYPGARAMSEDVLQSKVGTYARARGALHYHTHRSERSEAGFPDSVIVGNWVMYRELKSDSDSATVSKDQRTWIERLEATGADVDVWWPIDWETGKIQNEINACTRRRDPNGQLALPDIPKTLYLLTQAGVEARAGLLWDAGAKGIDRVTWQLNATHVMKAIANALPRTDEEIIAWIARHRLASDAGAEAFFNALRGDLLAPTYQEGESTLG